MRLYKTDQLTDPLALNFETRRSIQIKLKTTCKSCLSSADCSLSAHALLMLKNSRHTLCVAATVSRQNLLCSASFSCRLESYENIVENIIFEKTQKGASRSVQVPTSTDSGSFKHLQPFVNATRYLMRNLIC